MSGRRGGFSVDPAAIRPGVAFVNPGTGSFSLDYEQDARLTNTSAIQNAAIVITAIIRSTGKSLASTRVSQPNSAFILSGAIYSSFSLNVSFGAVQLEIAPWWRLQAVDNTGKVTAFTPPLTTPLQVELLSGDSPSVVGDIPWTNGSVAPGTGFLIFTVIVTDVNGVTLGDGTTTQPLAVPGTNLKTTIANTAVTYKIAVITGITYTLTGTGLTFFGAQAVFSVV